MLDDPYYAHHSQQQLSCPLTVCSVLGGKCNAVAQSITALSGLPLVDVDRTLEHQFGTSLREACAKHGLHRVTDRKTEVIEKALTRAPFAVIGLGDITLVSPTASAILAKHTTTAYLEWHPLELRQAILEELERHPGRYPSVLPGTEVNYEAIRGFLLQGGVLFTAPSYRFKAAGREPYELAQDVLAKVFKVH